MKTSACYIGENVFETLVASHPSEQERGLMGVPFPPPVMSFPYKNATVAKFWMKNTPSPLDIVFVSNGFVTQLHQGEPFSLEPIGHNLLSDLVIELPLGTVKSCGIELGQKAGLL